MTNSSSETFMTNDLIVLICPDQKRLPMSGFPGSVDENLQKAMG